MMPASTATLFQMDLQAVVAAVAKNSRLGRRKRKVLANSWVGVKHSEVCRKMSVEFRCLPAYLRES